MEHMGSVTFISGVGMTMDELADHGSSYLVGVKFMASNYMADHGPLKASSMSKDCALLVSHGMFFPLPSIY